MCVCVCVSVFVFIFRIIELLLLDPFKKVSEKQGVIKKVKKESYQECQNVTENGETILLDILSF